MDGATVGIYSLNFLRTEGLLQVLETGIFARSVVLADRDPSVFHMAFR